MHGPKNKIALANILPFMCKTNSHIHTIQQAELYYSSVYFTFSLSRYHSGRQTILDRTV